MSISNNDLIDRAIERLLKNRSQGNENHLLNSLYGLENYSGVKYWEYINVDVLTGIQHPKTDFPDEMTFIVYHQICELYFKLIVHEIDQIQKSYLGSLSIQEQIWTKRIARIRRYFDLLLNSFEQVLSVNNFDSEEFFQFRMALIPASGFQTAQFRKIEIMLTDLENLTFDEVTMKGLGIDLTEDEKKSTYERIYWKLGARDKSTKEKSRLLRDFEDKYDFDFRNLSERQKKLNLNTLVKEIDAGDNVKCELRLLDKIVVDWKRKHYEVLGPHFLEFKGYSKKYGWEVDPNKGTGDTNVREFLTASMKLNYFK